MKVKSPCQKADPHQQSLPSGLLTLPLFVFRVALADHKHPSMALDDLAVHTPFLYRRFYFHTKNSFQHLLKPVNNPATGKIVGRKLHEHPIARKNLDVVHTHLA
ncbi:hypothetical protein ES703_37385 [subsurface metagenome]